jgi:hypothetical protein
LISIMYLIIIILTHVRFMSLSGKFSFPKLLVISGIISYLCWPFICLLWEAIRSFTT